ncbi:MAG: bifunctional riboflavin kinase/FAD synthetase [Firmicutes bacterium]|nr:bifunctional riboflavin kinase/FAD synthetase [Bacillota bacterium]
MKELKSRQKPIALALGYFDCIHFAHRKIIQSVCEFAEKNRLNSAVATFSNDTLPNKSLPIYSYADRKKLLAQIEVDFVIPLEFNEDLKNMSPEDFLLLLHSRFNIKHIACGFDYRFGKDGSGDVELLKSFAKTHDISLKVFCPIKIKNETVSTSLIKDALSEGDIARANAFLSSPYFIEGRVTRGRGRGLALGFPTANIKPIGKIIPKFGVYKSRTTIDGKVFYSITNIGNRPTFNDDAVVVETFVNGSVFDLYSKNICVELLGFIRDVIRFDSAAELILQIKKDVKHIKKETTKH